jgi:peptide/nickel transport system substrate-binding protein
MTIVLPNNYSDWVAAATEVTTELKKVGINVSTDLPQYAQYSAQIQSGSFDAAIGGYGGSGSPYTDFNNALSSNYAAPIGTPTANNFERFKSPSVDKSLAKLASATDPATQQAATDQLEQVMYTQSPVVLLYFGGSWGLFSTKNFTGWPSASDPYALPTSYTNAALMVLTHLKKS